MKKILTILGSALLIAGCFFPIMNVGDQTFNFFADVPPGIPNVPQNAMMYVAIVIIAIAIICAVLALMNRAKFVWTGGIITGCILAAVYFGFHSKMDEMKKNASDQVNELIGGMFKELTDSLFQSVELGGTGWYVIGSGALLLLVSAAIKEKSADLVQ